MNILCAIEANPVEMCLLHVAVVIHGILKLENYRTEPIFFTYRCDHREAFQLYPCTLEKPEY